MNEVPKCAQCGLPKYPDAPSGLCPTCLLQAGFESRPVVGTSSGAFTSLPIEQLAEAFSHLDILELLGRGGMGTVYKARQKNLDRLVALKILPPEIGQEMPFAERFTREAKALARLSHSHIVSVYDYGQVSIPIIVEPGGLENSKPLFFILMEYVDGVNLRQAIQSGSLSPTSALTIVPEICEALQYAHDNGIVHRDIKPENILLDKRGQVKIADFGLAKILGSPLASPLTGTNQVMGTMQYMAPEQMKASPELDHRADIFSLGVVFYEILTGQLPIGRFSLPSKTVHIDVRLDEIVLRALEQEPELRYQQASAIKTDVDALRRTPTAFVPTPAADYEVASRFPPPHQGAKLCREALIGAFCLPVPFVAFFFLLKLLAMKGQGELSDLRVMWIFVLLPFGLAAPITTTILGIVAIKKIKTSGGKLYGMRLAVFDAILFPLGGIIVLAVLLIMGLAATVIAGPASPHLVAVLVVFAALAAVVSLALFSWAMGWLSPSASRLLSRPTDHR